jgi:hypothetical protein
MGKINFGRVLLGGLVAGLVINIGEFLLNGIILRGQMAADFKRMNLTPPGASLIVFAVGSTFVMGIVAVLVYAMIRSRLGPGPRTAIVAALVIWFLVYAYSGTFNLMMISIPPNVILMVLGWGLVEYFVGILAGAALYKET